MLSLSSSSGERSETGGPSGAEGDLFRHNVLRLGLRQFRALARRWVPRSAALRALPEDDERNQIIAMPPFTCRVCPVT